MKALTTCLLVMIMACSKPTIITETKYQDVYIPVPCQTSVPQLLPYTGDIVIDMLSLEEYIAELKLALGRCVYDK